MLEGDCSRRGESLTLKAIETWMPVRGWEDSYEVSDLGNVRSLPRTISRSDGSTRRLKGRTLKPGRQKSGRDRYLRVGLCRGGKLHMEKVHHLVATAFHGEREDGMVCRHLNDVPSDNRAVNLAWGSGSDNQKDSVRNVRHTNTKKEQCLRGHALEGPNLTGEREGHRDCKACRLARRSLLRRFGSYTEDEIQRLSDERYQSLVPSPTEALEVVA